MFWWQTERVESAGPAVPLSLRLDAIPPRSEKAITGTEFARRTAKMSGAQRQREAIKELRNGNIPDFLRTLKPVRLSYTSDDGMLLTATIWVAPDYLSIGSEADFLRIPLTYPSAIAIANRFNCLLPTRKMVDAIYEQATVHLKPSPMTPGPEMRSSAYYLTHQKKIETQFECTGYPHGVLVSGHKKDVVLTNRLFTHPGHIAIYGWHQLNGDPIQPLSTIHGARYADYSHGIRLVYQQAWIKGQDCPEQNCPGQFRPIVEILQDPALAPVLTYESLIPNLSRLMKQE